MAPKKGNKHAKGYGRPPEEHSDDEVIQLGKEMLEWMKQSDASNLYIVHMSEYYRGVKGIPRSTWRTLRKRLCFVPYYEQAMDWLLVRLLKNNKMETAYGSRYLAIYDTDLKDHEKEVSREKVDYELTRKLEIDKSRSEHPNDAKLDELIRSIKEKK